MVTGDSNDDTVGGNNHLWSALLGWTKVNPISNGETETNERAQEYSKWLEQQIVDHVNATDFHTGAENSGPCPLHFERYTAGNAFQFHAMKMMRNFSSVHMES